MNRAHSWVQVISSTCRSVGRLLRFGKTWTGMALRLWICQMHEPRRGVQCIVLRSHAELFFFVFGRHSLPSKDLEVAVGGFVRAIRFGTIRVASTPYIGWAREIRNEKIGTLRSGLFHRSFSQF
jgi:hypothetical protein